MVRRPGVPGSAAATPPADPSANALGLEHTDHAVEGQVRASVEVTREHGDDPPAITVEPLAPTDVLGPLRPALGMLATVVLDRDLDLGVGMVEAEQPGADVVADDEVDNGLR